MYKSILSLLLFSTIILAQNINRYTDSVFTVTQTVTNGTYATAQELNMPYQGESLTHSSDLKFHLFTPTNDTLKKRPMFIAIHGGGFVSGNKENEDMIEFCKLFAQRGYVTATIQYRLGMSLLSSISGERAVYRGLQDGRAAIRFFKDNWQTYGVDTNNIYLVGSSAGAFIALHNLFLNEETEKPAGANLISHFPPTLDDGPDLGKLDAINLMLKHGSNPNGVISLWGALQDTTLIKVDDGNIPLLLIHGTADNIVPFDVGSPFNAVSLPSTYGSKPISERLSAINKNAETYFVSNEGHEFYGVLNGNWNPAPNNYWDTIVTKTSKFLWNIHKPIAKFGYEDEYYGQIFHFKDSSTNATQWEWDFGDGNKSFKQNPTYEYSTWGKYLVTLKVKNLIESWDTTSTYVQYVHVSVNDEESLPKRFKLAQNYPNPFNPTTTIKYSIPVKSGFAGSPQNVSLKIYNTLGQEIATLVNKNQKPGRYEVEFDANNLPSGIYIYRLVGGEFILSKKLLLLK